MNAEITAQRIESFGRTLAILVGSLFSPILPLVKWLLLPHIDLDAFLAGGLSLPNVVEFILSLEALGTEILMRHIAPILAGCCLLAFLYLALCGNLGVLLTRYLIRQLKTRAEA